MGVTKKTDGKGEQKAATNTNLFIITKLTPSTHQPKDRVSGMD